MTGRLLESSILSNTTLTTLAESRDMKTGFTCGAFDLLHAGHVLMLQEAKSFCDYLIVGLHSDPSIDRKSKNKPIQSLEERLIQIRAVKFVDLVVIYDTEEELVKLLKAIRPSVRILGADYIGKSYTGDELDIEVVYNTRDHGYSSSELRSRIAAAGS